MKTFSTLQQWRGKTHKSLQSQAQGEVCQDHLELEQRRDVRIK